MAAIYKWLLRVGKVAGAISFLVAAPYALVQYWQAQSGARVEQTLAMYKLYNTKPFTDYREHITNVLVQYREKINAAVGKEALTAIQLEMVSKQDLEMDLLLVFDFYDGLAVCVATKVCDDATAVALFKDRAYDVYVNFYQYMAARREQATPKFGFGLEAVARSGQPPAAKPRKV